MTGNERVAGLKEPERARVGRGTAPPPLAVGGRVDRPLFDRESLAAYLRLSTDTVDRLVKAGKLPCVRIGHQVRFTLRARSGVRAGVV